VGWGHGVGGLGILVGLFLGGGGGVEVFLRVAQKYEGLDEGVSMLPAKI